MILIDAYDTDPAAAAMARLAGEVVRTPLLHSGTLNAVTGANVLVKAECLQYGGSFKYRGALNKLRALGAAARPHVVAYSSGNHAIATALAAARSGRAATLVMPDDAPAIKVDRVRAAGGAIEFYDRARDDRLAICAVLAQALQATILPSFDDLDIAAGQGSAIWEMIEDGRARGVEFDYILVPCGGGGLAAGAVLAAEALGSPARIVTVEPHGFDDMARSIASGARENNLRRAGSICDALLVERPGLITFPIIQRRAEAAVVDDEQVHQAMGFAFRYLKLVVEPGGAVGLAALLSIMPRWKGRNIGVVLSGGNVDGSLFADTIGRPAAGAVAAREPALAGEGA